MGSFPIYTVRESPRPGEGWVRGGFQFSLCKCGGGLGPHRASEEVGGGEFFLWIRGQAVWANATSPEQRCSVPGDLGPVIVLGTAGDSQVIAG